MNDPDPGAVPKLRHLDARELVVRRVAPTVAFLVPAGMGAAALLSLYRGITAEPAGRVVALGLVSIPLWCFAFATAVTEADVRPSGALDPRPGLVESLCLLAVAAALAVFAYGPLTGLARWYGAVAFGVLAAVGYLLAPFWLGWRLVVGMDALGTALLTAALSVAVVVAGAVAGTAVARVSPVAVDLLGVLGVAGAVAVAYGVTDPPAVLESLAR